MGLDFYYTPGSAPCRNVLLTAKVLGVELNLKHLNLMEGEHLKPEFLKINPQHCVPTLDDNGFAIWESRAICGYLVNQYGKDDSLYPKDPKQRALVDCRLYFDMGTLYAAFAEYYYPTLFMGKPKDPAKLEKINNAFKFLDGFLAKTEYAAGNSLTIADLALASTVSTFDIMDDFDLAPFTNVTRWFAKIKTLPAYEEGNGKPVLEFKNLVDRLTKK